MEQAKLLYHYTGQAGLMGIIHSKGLWATDCLFLNDSSEFSHSLTYAKRITGQIFEQDDYLAAFGWAVRTGLERLEVGNVCVASFSEKPDLLSQWRGYCPAGAGFCMGFDGDQLDEFCQENGYRLERCIYESRVLVNRVKKLLDECLSKFPQLHISREEYDKLSSGDQCEAEFRFRQETSEGHYKDQANEAVAWFCSRIVELAPLFKHEGFHEEAEWRIVCHSDNENLLFRPGPSYLCPYIKLPVMDGKYSKSLKEIIIGPNPNISRCESSIRMFLNTQNYSDIAVGCSSLPFNNW